MRKPRDFERELKVLADKAKALKNARVRQLGELVMATGADTLDADLLAGALLESVATKDAARKEGWRSSGASFFRTSRQPRRRSRAEPEGGAEREGGGPSA